MILLIALTLIQGAYGIQITASGGGNGEGGSVSINYDALTDSAVNSEIAINGADLTPSTAISGSIAKFEQNHAVKDTSGKSASVYVKVLNAPNGLTYSSKVLPKEGSVATQTQVSAEQWLTVPKADSIKCTATSSYGTIRSASVGLEEARSTATGDYVTLTKYYGKAVTTGTSVLASQTATSGAANSIKIYGTAKDSSGTYKVDTSIKGISGGKATFSGLGETASAGTTTQVTQKEHLKGTFTGKATAVTKTITRTSNYGTEYDLNLAAKKSASGPTVSGVLGYYISPTLKIQGAVNAALSGDTINVAAGTYKENVKIDKSLTVKGAGSAKTIVDGNKAGSVFTVGKINPNAIVSLSGMTLQGGSGTAESRSGKTYLVGGGIYNKGKLTLTSCAVSKNTVGSSTSEGYGGGIYNGGYYSGSTWIPATLDVISCTISENTAQYGGGIDNDGKATIKTSMISRNIASASTGESGGGGIVNWNIMNVMDSTVSGNTAALNGGGIANPGTLTVQNCIISSNTAKLVGGGIASSGTLTVTGGTISGNSASRGGGVANGGTLTVTGGTISGNSAKLGGGGIANFGGGKLTVTGSIISGNRAGTADNKQSGGGIQNSGTATIANSKIFGNKATWDGAGLHNWQGTMRVTNSKVYGNTAGENGGGVYNGGFNGYHGSMTLENCAITGNKAGNLGGGVANFQDASTTVNGCTISGNTAYNGGGLANWDGGTLTMRSDTISGNIAANNGGGIYSRDGTLYLSGTSQIVNNQATSGYGGGIYSNKNTVTFDGTNVAIKSNKAHLPSSQTSWYKGWGVYLTTGTPILKNGFNPTKQVTGNTHI